MFVEPDTSPPLIVAQYNTADYDGGAAKAAWRLSEALCGAGVRSKLLCRHKGLPHERTIRLTERRTEMGRAQTELMTFWQETAAPTLIHHNRSHVSSTVLTVDLFGLEPMEAPFAAAARVHHVHWTAGFLSPSSIETLKAAGKPIVLTLHDEFWYTGGCHYTAGCRTYERGCDGACPQLMADRAGLLPAAFAQKRKVLEKAVTVVCPSTWIAKCARKSAILGQCDVRVVRNPVDTALYDLPHPAARQELRAEMGCDDGDVVLLFGAASVADKRKGFSVLIDALRCLRHHTGQSVKLVSFGRGESQLVTATGLDTIHRGAIADEAELARLYGAADLLIVPSLEDNYPNTIVEALCCGTPVVAFDAGGISDLVDGETTGLLATPVGEPDGLAAAIAAAMERFVSVDPAAQERRRMDIRRIAEPVHRPDAVARQMVALYGDIAPDFHAPLSAAERALTDAHRNGSVPARLVVSREILSTPSVATALLPLKAVHDAAKARERGARQDGERAVVTDADMAVGRTLSGARFLGEGWGGLEQRGVWTADRRATLYAHVPNGVSVAGLTLNLFVWAGQEQKVMVSVDGVRQCEWQVSARTPMPFSVRFGPVAGPVFLTVTLAFPAAVRAQVADTAVWRAVHLTGLRFHAR